MPVGHFLLPAVLGGVKREEADQCFRVSGDIIGDIAVINPQTRASSLAAKDDGFIAVLCARPIGCIARG